ncbi:MAG: Flp family type IVb pilin [Actinobacteria bacterium]|nr:Flp family type IVb pilin [Actinomycetota bacterium]
MQARLNTAARGAALVAYALRVPHPAVVSTGALTLLGGGISGKFTEVNKQIAPSTTAAPAA